MTNAKNLKALLSYGVTLAEDEVILWIGRPSSQCYKIGPFTGKVIRSSPAVPVVICLLITIMICSLYTGETISIFTIPLPGPFMTALMLGYAIYKLVVSVRDIMSAVYAVTNQRVIICKKSYGNYYISISINELISKCYLPVKAYQGIPVGTIAFDSGKTKFYSDSETGPDTVVISYDYFECIEDPQLVFDLINAPQRSYAPLP